MATCLTSCTMRNCLIVACLVLNTVAFGASSFSTDFSGPILDGHLVDYNPALTSSDFSSPQYTVDGTAHLTNSLEDYWTYKYIQTSGVDFRGADWTCTIEVHAADWSGAAVPSAYGLRFGIGNGIPSKEWNKSCAPYRSVVYSMNPQSYFWAASANDSAGNASPVSPYQGADSRGDWTLTMTKTGNNLVFKASRARTQWDLARNLTYATIDLSTVAPWLNDTNTRVFFGGGSVATQWDDMSLTVTSAESPGDEEVIQCQINSLGPSGGTIRLEPRVYTINHSIVLPDNVTVQGAGMSKTTIRMAPNRPNAGIANERMPTVITAVFQNQKCDELIWPEGNHDITIKDLTIDGDAANNPYVDEGIYLAYCYNYRIENVRVMNCRGFGGIYTGANHYAARTFKNYILNTIIEGNQQANNRDAAYGHGIYITARDNDNVLVNGCITRNNHGSGIHVEDNPAYCYVEDCESHGNAQHGIWFCETTRSEIRSCKVHNNACYGVVLSQGAGNEANLIEGNSVYRNGYAGIYVSRPYGSGNSGVAITRNTVKNNDQGSMAHPGILIDSTAGVNYIGFNYAYDDQATPTQEYGIAVYSTGNVIANNFLRTNKLGESNIAANNVVIDWDYDKAGSLPDLVATDVMTSSGTLTGRIMLDSFAGILGTSVTPVRIELRPMTGGSTLTRLVFINPEFFGGTYNYSTDVDPGTYTVAFYASGFLRRAGTPSTVIIASDGEATCDVSLTGGDVDGDNEVTTTDLSVVLMNMDMVGD